MYLGTENCKCHDVTSMSLDGKCSDLVKFGNSALIIRF